jgi:Family of unknown function (DUF6623)
MAVYGNWIHGNSLVVEDPSAMYSVTHLGWGTVLRFKSGRSSWLHACIPTQMAIAGAKAKLSRVYIRFKATGGRINQVHVYDGAAKILERKSLNLKGTHFGLDQQNTFNLPAMHLLDGPIGISFEFQSSTSIDEPAAFVGELHAASFGADFDT